MVGGLFIYCISSIVGPAKKKVHYM